MLRLRKARKNRLLTDEDVASTLGYAVQHLKVKRSFFQKKDRLVNRTNLKVLQKILRTCYGCKSLNVCLINSNLKRKVLSAGGNILCLLLSVKRCVCGEQDTISAGRR